MRVRTCLNRKLGNCKDCEIDYNPITSEHPYNNLDCPNYKESITFVINILEKEENKKCPG